jgi:peptidyl-tRNA hydrolase, PTH1 family
LAPLFPLVVGLGNPGAAYADTRHNVGFMVLDEWAAAEKVAWKKVRFADALAAQTGDGIWLLKPQGYMNVSGVAVRAGLDWFKLAPEQVLVVVDDVSLGLGKLRLREKGSAGGHNGLGSIEQHLGSQAYARLRCGVGAAPDRVDLADHVLGRFRVEEKEILKEMMKRAVDGLKMCEHQGAAAAMNKVNREV